ncbi:helix-turn-helix transcriptional regulator [Halomicrococcus gelatinilyticus]|uniref:helix-turn-helix transcriptional regulator n=1 Tax=Halomicrococcus gelatinilyticus TaxID=1702103 RepID=UPI002E14EBBF
MTTHGTEPETRDASNVLVLAPLTPAGNRDCMELVAATPPEELALAAVTYTQPPDRWTDDWLDVVGSLPAETQFVHANRIAGAESYEETTPGSVSSTVVDPADPMEIVVPVSDHLERHADESVVVVVQTLSVMLEYVDFDTAFRYLHVLTHRVQAAGAVGYYQLDPAVHDPETVDTLTTLFDAVVEVTDDGYEWTSASAYEVSGADGRAAVAGHGSDPDGLLARLRGALAGVLDREPFSSLRGGDERTDATTASRIGGGTTAGWNERQEAESTSLANEEMLTDEERIRTLLIQYGGQMKQADITAETSWSKSTVSRKLSKMEEEETITRMQVGRGNLVFLNGSEPEASTSSSEA